MSQVLSAEWVKSNDFKHKMINKWVYGRVLDVGFAQFPNKFLSGFVVGVDKEKVDGPGNYSVVVESDLDVGSLPKGEFDTIIFCDVLEHLENPLKVLREANSKLSDNGVILITFPNVYEISHALRNVLKMGYAVNEHLYSFNYNNIVLLLEKSGFRLVKWKGFRFKIPFINLSVRGAFIPVFLSSEVVVVACKHKGSFRKEDKCQL